MRKRAIRVVAAAGCAVLALSGCGRGLDGITLPGGAAVGDNPYRVTVDFADVLDLVPQASVKVDDVAVGTVERVRLNGFTARVTLKLKRSAVLPDNAEATIRQTSLLGEKFVSLSAPTGEKVRGRLTDGDAIPLSRTGRSVELEEVLSALSLLLSGGGLEQLRVINVELGKALKGREPQVKALLGRLDTFVGTLDGQKGDIIRALESLDRLTATLKRQRTVITTAIDSIGPGLKVLADQRRQLTEMLTALSDLGAVGTRVIEQSRRDTVANLKDLRPILEKLQESGKNLPNSLELALTYPFPRTVDKAVFETNGRYYTNLEVTLDLDLGRVLSNLLSQGPAPMEGAPPSNPDGTTGHPPMGVPGLPGITTGPVPGAGQDSKGGLVGLLIGGLAG
ncbi:MAG: mammalian cell entry protein [Cryptosporangiaceae bacterium]|jgi:phospholipid/cholesterol/gamma-HCH transport system substrate-binding protein|nr:mammalian cell entry protein [Cryptosporangiaceae bacterium]